MADLVINTPPLERLKYKVLIDSRRHREAYNWCEKTFGKKHSPIDNRSGVWGMYWAGVKLSDKYLFRFTYEADLLWFKLACS